ncbi:MAG: oligopeptide/dipeptide ABC transporter ATP-binding protein [Bauldia sp.]
MRSALMRRVVAHVDGVADVSLDVFPGTTVGLVGESGSGKSTLARTIMGLLTPAAGEILYRGKSIAGRREPGVKSIRREIQMVFQDPYGSLNPRKSVEQIISECWLIHPGLVPRRQWKDAVADLLTKVGLSPDYATRYPHQFSGGQRQRIGLARALAAQPKLIVCDEPVAALDVSIQAQIVNLLKDLQKELGLSYLFIAHDLAVVRQMCDVVAVMYLGRIVEQGPQESFFARPKHPYSQALLSAAPIVDPWNHKGGGTRIVLSGEPPSPANPPTGCAFHTRCWKAEDICHLLRPPLRDMDRAAHTCACHFAAADV